MTLDLFAPKKHAPTLHHGDCLAVLRTMPDASVDAVVTDPPYLIDFMGKGWDSADGIAGKPEVWAECLRVLKPGGHLLAFGATRTYHRMACAIEDAGFEIRDSIHWMYGSGFPKSLDVSKAMDKSGGIDATEFKKWLREKVASSGFGRGELDERCGFTMRFDTPYENDPVGWGVSLPTPEKWQTIKQVLSIEDNTWDALLKRVWRGRAGEKVSKSSSMSGGHFKRTDKGAPVFDNAKQWQGWGTALKPSHEPVVVARKPLAGTVAANVERYGTGALNIDGCRVETDETITNHSRSAEAAVSKGKYGDSKAQETHQTAGQALGRWPPNLLLSHTEDCTESACDETCAVAELDRQSGVSKARHNGMTSYAYQRLSRVAFNDDKRISNTFGYGDSGGASRFFPVFRYQAKPSRSEREAGCENLPAKTGAEAVDREEGSAGTQSPRAGAGRTATEVRNGHPTVKPIALIEWLVTLVTPPGGVVLDPFLGSGTTGVAAVRKGFRFVGIEREDEYLAIARARIEAA